MITVLFAWPYWGGNSKAIIRPLLLLDFIPLLSICKRHSHKWNKGKDGTKVLIVLVNSVPTECHLDQEMTLRNKGVSRQPCPASKKQVQRDSVPAFSRINPSRETSSTNDFKNLSLSHICCSIFWVFIFGMCGLGVTFKMPNFLWQPSLHLLNEESPSSWDEVRLG